MACFFCGSVFKISATHNLSEDKTITKPNKEPNRGRNNREPLIRVNERIRAPKVRVVLANGDQLGVLSTKEAIERAKMYGLDLVEITAQADPPVCKIIDFGKYKYEQSKLKKQKSKSAPKIKEVKFRIGTGQHDYNIKLNRAEQFLDASHKVRFVLQFKGRENAHKDLGFVMMQRIIEDLKTMAQVDQAPKLGGRSVAMTLSPLAQHLRKRKFQMFHGELIEEDEEDEEVTEEDVFDDVPEEEVVQDEASE